MSHFTIIRTSICDVEALVKALADKGFHQVEVHNEATHLYGYRGDRRQETAEVIIRRKNIGWLSNDIGFKRTDDGTFVAVISDYDRKKYSQQWLGQLTQHYAYHAAMAKLGQQGFTVVNEETQWDGKIHLTLRRAV
jgi:hypothetical protein